MPYVRTSGPTAAPPSRHGTLRDRLLAELKSESSTFGQPLIVETFFDPGIELRIFWDEWLPLSDADRSTVAIAAYSEQFGDERAGLIGLLETSTYPEAELEGSLPYEVVPLLRKSDPVTREQCEDWMREFGASEAFDRPRLLFPTEKMAEECYKALRQHHPEAAEVWAVTQRPVISLGGFAAADFR